MKFFRQSIPVGDVHLLKLFELFQKRESGFCIVAVLLKQCDHLPLVGNVLRTQIDVFLC